MRWVFGMSFLIVSESPCNIRQVRKTYRDGAGILNCDAQENAQQAAICDEWLSAARLCAPLPCVVQMS
jgi:hypothetical protein